MLEKMSPAEIMAKAAWKNPRSELGWGPLQEWEDVPAEDREAMIEDMRAALRALAECEPTEAMEKACPPFMRAQAYILAAASEE